MNKVNSNEEVVVLMVKKHNLTEEQKKQLLKDLERDYPTLSKDFQDNLNKGIEKLQSRAI